VPSQDVGRDAITDACGARIALDESRDPPAGIDLNQPAAKPHGLANPAFSAEILRR